jgi:hypothetical protein
VQCETEVLALSVAWWRTGWSRRAAGCNQPGRAISVLFDMATRGHRRSTVVDDARPAKRRPACFCGTSKLVMHAPGVPRINPHPPATPTAYHGARRAATAPASRNQQQPSTTGLSRNA